MAETVRIALVLNGGVSLAIWMGGVTHEIDRARNGIGLWANILTGSGRSIEVDLIAGTSAGGLNGSLLATAIARGEELIDLHRVWVENGRLIQGALIGPADAEEADSVLDGDFFEAAVASLIPDAAPPGGTWGDQPVTLLVTASALQGADTEAIDAQGVEFTAGDHRRVYRFRHHPQAVVWQSPIGLEPAPNDFSESRDGLIRAARASAGFPFAFAPVVEPPELAALRVDNQNQPEGANPVPNARLIDGGVLDNAPFGPLLEELWNRPRSDPGPRWVMYIVPSVDTAKPAPAETESSWSSLLGRIVTLSRESDLRSDVEQLREQFRVAQDLSSLPEVLIGEGFPGMTWADAFAVANKLLPAYRATTASRAVRSVSGPNPLAWADPPSPSPGMFANPSWWLPSSVEPFAGAPARWQWGSGRAIEMTNWISRRLRRLMSAQGTPAATAAAAAAALEVVAAEQEKVVAIKDALSRLIATIETVPGIPPFVYDAVPTAPGGAELLAALTESMATVIDAWAAADAVPNAPAGQRLVATAVLLNSHSWIQKPAPPFSLYLVSPQTPNGPWLTLPDLDSLATCEHWPNRKLYGDRLMNFAAFLDPAFINSDWLWGRLDGALTLAKAILSDADEDTAKALLSELAAEILAEAGVTQEELYQRTLDTMEASATQLLTSARDSNSTQFEPLLDDAKRYLLSTDWLRPAPGTAFVRGAKWVVRTAVGGAVRWAKRWARG